MNKYSDEIRAFIEKNYKGNGPTVMTELVNKTFGTDYTKSQIRSYYKNHKLNSGVTGRFEKGHIPANKGRKGYCHPRSVKTQFKKGNIPVNHRSIGSERKDKDGYIRVKVAEPKTWKLKHRLLWEENKGPIPKGYIVIFKDGNKENINLENLALVSRAESAELSSKSLWSNNPKLTEAGINVTRIRNIVKKNGRR